MHSMGGAKVFSTLDVKSAYNQIPLTEDSKELTAFISSDSLFRWCSDSLFRWCKIPFGLASAPSYSSKMMLKVVDSCRDICVLGKDGKMMM